MNENVINSLFVCFDRLRITSLTRFLRASLRTLVNYFSIIDQNKQINSIYFLNPQMDFVYIWSKILLSTISTPVHDLEVKVTDLEILC